MVLAVRIAVSPEHDEMGENVSFSHIAAQQDQFLLLHVALAFFTTMLSIHQVETSSAA